MKKLSLFSVLFLMSALYLQVCGQVLSSSISNGGTVINGQIVENTINFSVCTNAENPAFPVTFVLETGYYTIPPEVIIRPGLTEVVVTNGNNFTVWRIYLTANQGAERPIFENLKTVYCANGETITLPTVSSNGITGGWGPPSFVAEGDTVIHAHFEATWGQCVENRVIYVDFTVRPREERPIFENLQTVYCGGETITLPPTSNGIAGVWEPQPLITPVVDSDTVIKVLFEATWGECVETRIVHFEFTVIPCENSLNNINEDDVVVFPNPTTGTFCINTESNIKLYSIQGILLKETYGKEMDLSGYPQGMYFLQINKSQSKVLKIIKN